MTKDNGSTCAFNVCSQCKTICCQDAKPPLTEKRKKLILEALKAKNINLKSPFTKQHYSHPSIDKQAFCRLFDKTTGKCIVHSVKPETCVAGPVTFDIDFQTKKVEWFLKKPEICAYAEMLYSDKSAFKKHFEVAKKEIMHLILELNANELQAILKIEEPQTFKIGEDDLPKKVAKKLGLE